MPGACPPAPPSDQAYPWPRPENGAASAWRPADIPGFVVRDMPETPEALAVDSRWPAFFPSPLCLVTARAGETTALEKTVGACIVNRFPYTLALSFCVRPLSARHYPRTRFLDVLMSGGRVAVQFLPPGPALDRALTAVADLPDDQADRRIAAAGLPVSLSSEGDIPVFDDAYLVYEARLAEPGRDFHGGPIHERPYVDVGSHRVVFLEITAIQLDADIAEGRRRIRWRSLPFWRPQRAPFDAGPGDAAGRAAALGGVAYRKSYASDYRFPSAGTIGFEADGRAGRRALKRLPPFLHDQVEIDDDRARWPCFFPSSVGMITSRDADGRANIMPCGSTTVVSRHPFVLAACVSYSPINARYAPRATLDAITRAGRFGCGVPFAAEGIESAVGYLGNVSIRRDPAKIANAGLTALPGAASPLTAELPVHYDCRLVGQVRMGTHVMLLGEAERIFVRDDVTPDNPLLWRPWADLIPGDAAKGDAAEDGAGAGAAR
jgi:flavin reductase (DIM6/NTAB) family NADH-FMN oxidoreductase RutF